MRRTSRQLLAVMVVTTVLCADQVTSAAPALAPREPAQSLAKALASRLTGSLRRTVVAPRMQPARREGESIVSLRQMRIETPVLHASRLSPFQFRLPPPTL